MARAKHYTSGNDTITHGLDEIQDGNTWWDLIFGWGGNDVLNISATPWGQDYIDSIVGKSSAAKSSSYWGYQRHVYAGSGDDQINLVFEPYVGKEAIRVGHHTYGDIGSDTFNFKGVNNVLKDQTVVGRLEDFDVTRDKIQIDGKTLNFDDLPDNVRIVAYNGQYFDHTARPQQWLLINNDQGGHVFYALEGVRYDFNAPGNDEMHFIYPVPTDYSKLVDVKFEDVHPYVPYSEYKDLNPANVIEYYNRDFAPKPTVNVGYGKLMTTGSNDPAMVDVINASAGYDFIYARAGNDLIAGGNTTDHLYGEAGNDKIWSGTEEDFAYGGAGNDYIEGNYGEDMLYGGAGNDKILGNQDSDTIYGDSGGTPPGEQVWQIDRAFQSGTFANIQNGSVVTIAANTASTGLTITDNDALLEDNNANAPTQQTLDVSLQTLTFNSDALAEGSYVYSRGYYDVLNQTTGETGKLYQIRVDQHYAGSGMPGTDKEYYVFDNSITLGASSKITITSSLNALGNVGYSDIADLRDTADLYTGNDTVDGGSGDDLLYGGRGNDQVQGGEGKDVLWGEDGDDTVDGGGGNDQLYGGLGNDHVQGGDGIDLLLGEEGNDTLSGGAGDDRLWGAEGNDDLLGDAGTDYVWAGNGNDWLYGGDGNDMLYAGAGQDHIYGGNGNDRIQAGSQNDSVMGGGGNDLIYGEDGDDALYGNGGNDRIYGGTGIDDLYGGTGDDYIAGGTGNDALYGYIGKDTLSGGTGNDDLYAGADSDRLYGNAGNDVLNGGSMDDWLWGGSGDDVFWMSSGQDKIADFQDGHDKINVSAYADDFSKLSFEQDGRWLHVSVDEDKEAELWLLDADEEDVDEEDFVFA